MGVFYAVVAAPEAGTGEFPGICGRPARSTGSASGGRAFSAPGAFSSGCGWLPFHVVHDILGAWEHGIVHALEDVAAGGAVRLPAGGPEGHVDMAAVNDVAMEEFSPAMAKCVAQGGHLLLNGGSVEKRRTGAWGS